MEDLRSWRPDKFDLITHVLDVTYDVWEKQLSPLVAEVRPDAVVAFGLSGKAATFTIETLARNVLETARFDARGNFPRGARIRDDGPDRYASTLRFAHDHAVSDDAGGYICNLTLYELLAHDIRATFVHVPMMQEDRLRAGARAILEAAATS